MQYCGPQVTGRFKKALISGGRPPPSLTSLFLCSFSQPTCLPLPPSLFQPLPNPNLNAAPSLTNLTPLPRRAHLGGGSDGRREVVASMSTPHPASPTQVIEAGIFAFATALGAVNYAHWFFPLRGGSGAPTSTAGMKVRPRLG